MSSKLIISDLRIWVHLGCGEAERHNPQMVSTNLEFAFTNIPKAVDSDRIEDTFCYLEVTKHIQALLKEKNFHLIEHLAKSIFEVTSEYIKASGQDIDDLTVHLRKISPPAPGIHGGVSFIYSGKP